MMRNIPIKIISHFEHINEAMLMFSEVAVFLPTNQQISLKANGIRKYTGSIQNETPN
jgi:hypothetical protein